MTSNVEQRLRYFYQIQAFGFIAVLLGMFYGHDQYTQLAAVMLIAFIWGYDMGMLPFVEFSVLLGYSMGTYIHMQMGPQPQQNSDLLFLYTWLVILQFLVWEEVACILLIARFCVSVILAALPCAYLDLAFVLTTLLIIRYPRYKWAPYCSSIGAIVMAGLSYDLRHWCLNLLLTSSPL